MTLDIETVGDGDTLEIVDSIERRQVSLRFPSAVRPEPADADAFVYPVDRAVAVRTRSIVIESGASATVLDESGEVHMNPNTDSWSSDVPSGEYYIDVSSHVKTYLKVDAPEGIEIETDDASSIVRIDFGTEVEVQVGARSTHERPEATITTTTAPEDVMAAVSYLGSALKDEGPMRSFPSLRGHPPAIELGDELRIPDELERPDTGITIEVPPSYDRIFPVAPLAYYLGAEVVPGDRPRLRTETGFEYPLDGPEGFETRVARTLKQTFTCDCFVRAAGPYAYELADREAFLEDAGIDPEAIYDRPLAEQVATYLSVPFEVVEPYVPRWGTGAHLEPMPDSVAYLPFLADDLAVVRSPAVSEAHDPSVETPAEGALVDGEFTRGATATADPAIGPTPSAGPDGPTIPSVGERPEPESGPLTWPGEPPTLLRPEPLDAQEQLWIADGIPLGADKPTIEAYRNAIDREPAAEIEIVVVCNDDRMADEDEIARDLLGDRTPFDVRIRPFRNVRTDELRELLERGGDFLHYIGHIDDRGFECPDGVLDAATLDAVDVDAFFLNACQSYAQGRHLIEAGAIAGVVTLADVTNGDAVRTGRSMARLLNNGFPLDTALSIASEEHDIDGQYTTVGDGSLQVTQAESNASVVAADAAGGNAFDYRYRSFVTAQFPLGSAYTPTIEDVDGWYLVGDEATARVSREALCDSLEYEDVPVRLDGSLRWAADLREGFCAVADYDEKLRESAELAVELADLEAAGEDDTEAYAETESRLEGLRRDIEDALSDFAPDDFRVAYRSLPDRSGTGAT